MWPMIAMAAASIGSTLLSGIFASKQAEEAAARTEYQRQQDRLWDLQSAQQQAPLQGAASISTPIQQLISNLGGTRR